jgi:hypothetical protein
MRDLGYEPCPDHPRYKAKRKPRVDCADCWDLYCFLNPHPWDCHMCGNENYSTSAEKCRVCKRSYGCMSDHY